MQSGKLYVGNFTYATTKEQLQELFASHGTVQNVTVIEGKGFGFVEMASAQEAEAAKAALDGKDFGGRTLKIDEARPPKSRDERGGGGFGRGGFNRGGGNSRGFQSRY
ncbi:MAG: RNA-binding protein [Candidatus Omnitrophica bacterium]|nr:RNA-binding protein [Candidatus Omnitrophota bacterium]